MSWYKIAAQSLTKENWLLWLINKEFLQGPWAHNTQNNDKVVKIYP